jgi:hypothetical protein
MSTAPQNDDQLFKTVMDNDQKRSQNGDSVMGAFRAKLLMILDRIEKDAKIQPKQVRAGAVANALKDLFVTVDENGRYGRSYRYLRQMGATLKEKGWELGDVNGTQMIAKIAVKAEAPKVATG